MTDLRTKFANTNGPARERPFFVSEREWDAFTAFVWGGKTLEEIAAEQGVPVKIIRRVLAAVDQNLAIPRASDLEWSCLTPASPIEDLHLSVRALNRLRHLRCATVGDVLRIDLARSRMGERSRQEVLQQLRRSGLVAVETDLGKPELARVSAQLRNLQEQIQDSTRSWKLRLERIEARLRRFAHEEG